MELTPYMLFLLGAMSVHCYENNLPLTITSIKEKISQRISQTHKTGRAVDISVRGWKEKEIIETVELFNEKYKDIAAISFSDNKPRAAVRHSVGSLGDHIHLQTRK